MRAKEDFNRKDTIEPDVEHHGQLKGHSGQDANSAYSSSSQPVFKL